MFAKQSENYHQSTSTTGPAPAYPQPSTDGVGRIAQGYIEQERLIGLLHEEIGTLEKRLDGMLRPLPASAQGNAGDSPQPPMSQLAAGLARFNSQTDAAIQRVRELTARLDF